MSRARQTRQERNADATYKPYTLAELETAAPGFPWRQFLAEAGLGAPAKLVVVEKTAFPKIAAIYASTPVEVLQAWLAFNVVDNASPLLSRRFADANFEFRSKALQGQPEQRVRWKRGVTLVNNQLNHAVGRLYAERYFTPAAKACRCA